MTRAAVESGEANAWTPTVSTGRLWLGVALAPAAWCVALGAGYLVVARSCEPPPNGLHAYGFPGIQVIDFCFHVAMSIVAAVGLWVAIGNLRVVSATRPLSDYPAELAAGAVDPEPRGTAPWWGRERFMSLAGVISSALFLLGVVLFAVPPFIVNACNQSR